MNMRLFPIAKIYYLVLDNIFHKINYIHLKCTFGGLKIPYIKLLKVI